MVLALLIIYFGIPIATEIREDVTQRSEATFEQLIESGLDRMVINIDGTDQETYCSYRKGGNLEKIIAGTESMVKAKQKAGKGPEVVFQSLVLRHNQHQIDEIRNLGEKLCVDWVALKTAQIYDFEEGNEFILTIDKYSRCAKDSLGKYSIKIPLDGK